MLDFLNAVQRAGSQVTEEAHVAAERLADAGLDRLLIPTTPALPEATAVSSSEYVQLAVEPDSVPQPVQRSAPPAFDLDALRTAIEEAVAQVKRAHAVAEGRSAIAVSLLQTAERLNGELDEIHKLKTKAEEAAAASREASERHDQCVLSLATEATAWLGAVAAWADSGPSTTTDLGRRPISPTATELTDDPAAATRTARTLHLKWIAPALIQARQDASEARAHHTILKAEQGRIDTELRALQDGTDLLPRRRTTRVPIAQTGQARPSTGSLTFTRH